MQTKSDMKVVIGVDGSADSNAAIRYILDSRWPDSAQFLVISAAPFPVLTGDLLATTAVEEILVDWDKKHRAVADEAADELHKGGLTARARMIRGDPRFVLEDEARKENADLIVVGTHGLTGVKRLLLGSVASHVVSHAPCSVLVVRKTPGQARSSEARGSR